jgi:hypothetical protein
VGDDLAAAQALVKGQPLYERRLKGVWAGYEVARRVSHILQLKKSEGTPVETTQGPFAHRSSYLECASAEREFEDLMRFVLSFDEGDAVFDLNSQRPRTIVLGKMRVDVLKNQAFLYRGHEASLLRDF